MPPRNPCSTQAGNGVRAEIYMFLDVSCTPGMILVKSRFMSGREEIIF